MSASASMAAGPRYGVIGHPVAHSRSPAIHATFARQTGIAVDYGKVLAPRDGFTDAVERFFAGGGRGLNVTLPFKLEARGLCGDRLSARAWVAGAVNWLAPGDDGPMGDNTDGIGLVRDLTRLLGDDEALRGVRVLLIGAGGAARGVVGPLLDGRPRSLTIVNRDADRAARLVLDFAAVAPAGMLRHARFEGLDEDRFDIVVNATAASIAGQPLPLPDALFDGVTLAYDMMYAPAPSRFLADAGRNGARSIADGLGMLVEQAAESFRLWHGVMPETASVLDALRAALAAEAVASRTSG